MDSAMVCSPHDLLVEVTLMAKINMSLALNWQIQIDCRNLYGKQPSYNYLLFLVSKKKKNLIIVHGPVLVRNVWTQKTIP